MSERHEHAVMPDLRGIREMQIKAAERIFIPINKNEAARPS